MAKKPFDSDNATRVGDMIRQLREAQDIGKVDLSRKSGIARSSIARIEAGQVEPSTETLGKLAEALDINVIDLAELIGLDATAERLPTPAKYFRSKYGMTADEAEELERQFDELLVSQGIDPNQPGPRPGEDE